MPRSRTTTGSSHKPTNPKRRSSSPSAKLRQLSIPTWRSVSDQLKASGAVSSTTGLQLIALPRNALRADYHSKADIRVERNGRPLFFLSVGRNLKNLRDRTTRFYRACPAIAIKPLFWSSADGWDYLGTEYFEGDRLETILRNGQISAGEAELAINAVIHSLEESIKSSTAAALHAELRKFFDLVADSPVFGDIDRYFLDGIVFPMVESGVSSQVPVSRWTNGDLTANNVLLTREGEAKLVDLEFAVRTHFFATDAWRWRTFSHLPADLLYPVALASEHDGEPWFDALCLLKQIGHLHSVHPPVVALEESRKCALDLWQVISRAHSDFRSEALFQKATEHGATPASLAPSSPTPYAQIFWSADGDFTDTQSQRLEVPPGAEHNLRFEFNCTPGSLNLRLDPTDRVGLIEITALRVRQGRQPTFLFTSSESTGWNLNLNHELLRLPNTPYLNLFSIGDDPSISLPTIEVDATAGPVVVELWLKFTSDLRQLRHLVPEIMLRPMAEQQMPALDTNLDAADLVAVPEDELAALRTAAAGEENKDERIQQLVVELDAVKSTHATQEKLNEETLRELAEIKEGSASELSAAEEIRARLSEELKGIKQECDSLVERESDCRAKLVDAQQAITKLVEENEHVQQEHSTSQERIRELVKKSLADEETIARLGVDLQRAKQETETELSKASEEYEKLRACLSASQDERQILLSQLEQIKETLVSKTHEIEEADARRIDDEETIARFGADLQRAKQETETELSKASEEYEKLRACFSASQDEQQILLSQLEQIKETLVSKTHEIEKADARRIEDAKLISSLKKEKARLGNLEISIAAARTEILQSEKTIKVLEKQLHESQASLNATRVQKCMNDQKLAERDQHVNHLNHIIHQLNESLQVAHAEAEKNNRHAAHLTHELHSLHAAHQKVHDELSRVTTTLDASTTHEEELENQLSGVREELIMERGEVSTLQNALSEHSANAAEERQSLQEQLHKARAERDDIADKYSHLTNTYSWRITTPLRFLHRQVVESAEDITPKK
ncbi:hypothetical protein N9K67_06230 [Opitutaceae bacterium]|nr:hypothetical protein [Opitutaceae bacterium]